MYPKAGWRVICDFLKFAQKNLIPISLFIKIMTIASPVIMFCFAACHHALNYINEYR